MIGWLWFGVAFAGEWRLLTGRVESVEQAEDGRFEVRIDRGKRDGVLWQGLPYRVYRADAQGHVVEVGRAYATDGKGPWTPASIEPNEGLRPEPGDRVVMGASVAAPASASVAYDLALQGVDLVAGGRPYDWAHVRKKPPTDAAVCATAEVCLALRWYAETGAETLTVGRQDAEAILAAWKGLGAPLAPSDAASALQAGKDVPDAPPYGELFAQRAWDALASGDAAGAAVWTQAGEALATRTGRKEDHGWARLTEARHAAIRGDYAAARWNLNLTEKGWPEGRRILLADAMMVHLLAGEHPWVAWQAYEEAHALGDLGMRWGFAGDAALHQARYADAKHAFEQCRRWHVEHPDGTSILRYGRCENGLAGAMIALGETEGSELHVQRAFEIAEALDDEVLRAETNFTMGDWFVATHDYGKAAEIYEVASNAYEGAGKPRDAALARLEMARAGWRGTGLAFAVVQTADEVLRLSREAGDDDSTARALQVLGEVELGLDDPRAAIALYEEALAIARERRRVRLQAELGTGLGVAKLAAGDAEGARAAYDAAVDAASGIPTTEAYVRAERGRAFGIASDLEAAAALYEQGGNLREATIAWADLAEVHRRNGELDAAFAAIEKAKATKGDQTSLAHLAMVMGRAERDGGDLARALELTEAAINDDVHLADWPHLFEATRDWLQLQVALRDFAKATQQVANLREGALSELTQQTVWSDELQVGSIFGAEALMRQGRLAAAEQAAAEAGQQRLQANDREAEVYAQILLSEIAFHRGNRQAALSRADRAVRLLALLDRPEATLQVDAYGALVTAELAWGDAPGALAAAEHAIGAAKTQTQKVNALRMRGEAKAAAGDLAGAEADLLAAIDGSDARVWSLHYELAATALAELWVAQGRVAEAQQAIGSVTTTSGRDDGQFDLVLWYRARLADAMVERAAGRTAEADRIVADLDYGARDTGALYWVARAAAFHDPSLDVWGEVGKLVPPAPSTGSFRDVVVSLETTHPDLADRVAVPTSQLEGLKADLAADEAMILPVVLPDRIGLIVVRAGREIVWRETIVPETTVDGWIRDLRDAAQSPLAGYVRGVKMVATADAGGSAPKADPAVSSGKLYDLLVRPALADLEGADTVVFAPAGRLRYVPFAALDDGERFLAEKYTVALLTSSGSTTKHRPLDPKAALLAMSNPDGSLPGATAEVQAIADTWGAKRTRVHDGAAATEEQLRAELPDVKLLHLATHGFLRNDEPRESYLLFAGPDGGEGRLTLREITLLPLDRIDLAVLSACQTAVGDLGEGKEIAGLAYQLEARGASAIVASLWPVDDASTSELMKHLYAELAKGTPRADALRKAQLAVMADPRWQHPFYWAPFVLVGDWR